MGGLCAPWITADDVMARPGCKDLDRDIVDRAASDASELLWGLTGRKYPGKCSMTVRPAARPSAMTPRQWTIYLESLGIDGITYSPSWGLCYGGAEHDSCLHSRKLDLKQYPVRAVTAVEFGGVALDPSTYTIEDDRYLLRIDGGTWPTCQDLTSPTGFAVTFDYGADPPGSVVSAAATFGAELALSRSDLPNRLPARLQSITREGVSMAVLDPMQFIQQGLTGIYEVDIVIRNENPTKATAQPLVWSPDLQPVHRIGTRYGG